MIQDITIMWPLLLTNLLGRSIEAQRMICFEESRGDSLRMVTSRYVDAVRSHRSCSTVTTCIIRDSKTNVRRTSTKRLGDCSILLAECVTVRQAAILTTKMHILKISIHSDSMIVVNAVNDKIVVRKNIINIIENIRLILLNITDYRMEYCNRNLNTEIDALTKKDLM